MIPINNSDTAWLIVADYNQDNAIGCPDFLREDVLDPDVNTYIPEYSTAGIVGTNFNLFADIGGDKSYAGKFLGSAGMNTGGNGVGNLPNGYFVGSSAKFAGGLVGGNLGSD